MIGRTLVTGGTGSLGRAITRQRIRESDDVVVVFSRSEYAQAQFHESLVADVGLATVEKKARWCLGDVRDPDRLRMAMRGVDTVIHAAALKRVDAVAQHPDEVVKTNIVGTVNVIRAAMDSGVQRVLVISSDKAVLPTTSYGTSKQMSEWIAVGMNTYTVPAGTAVAAIRYGNVLGSRGSVVHIWREAIRQNRNLPLTKTGNTRFIITMDQALQQIRFALDNMQGGEIFVPKLPWCYVEVIGQAMSPRAYFDLVGLRPGGEKEHEQLLSDEERHRCAETAGAYVVVPHIKTWHTEDYWTPQVPALIPAYVSGSGQRPTITPRELEPLIAAVPEGGLF